MVTFQIVISFEYLVAFWLLGICNMVKTYLKVAMKLCWPPSNCTTALRWPKGGRRESQSKVFKRERLMCYTKILNLIEWFIDRHNQITDYKSHLLKLFVSRLLWPGNHILLFVVWGWRPLWMKTIFVVVVGVV